MQNVLLKQDSFAPRTDNLLRMKLTVLLLIAFFQVGAHGLSQGKVSLNVKNETVDHVLREISQQTGLDYFFQKDLQRMGKRLDLSVKDMPIEDALHLCFKDQPFTYTIENNTIIVQNRVHADAPIIKNDSLLTEILASVIGHVTDEKNEPVAGAVVMVKGTSNYTLTDEAGIFILKHIASDAVLTISSIGYYDTTSRVDGATTVSVRLRVRVAQLNQAAVVATGYQYIPKERATGSFDLIDNKLINRSVSTNILDRIENLTPGAAFARGVPSNSSNTGITIRGMSTIFGNSDPLIVVDNFPYDGGLGNINPNDVESISILKDAAAASIWGARAANGVVVISTKRGKTTKPQLSITSNITVQGRPDLWNVNAISSADEIDLEKDLYSRGFYAGLFDPSQPYLPVTPVVQLLHDADLGTVSTADANAQIEAMKKMDVRKDIYKYMYRNVANQQYALNVSGSSQNVNYYLSGGWDHNINSNVASRSDRVTLRAQNTFKVLENLYIDAGLWYTNSTASNGNSLPSWNSYPYAKLADSKGSALPIYTYYNQSFLTNAEQSGLLNWEYKPLSDIYNIQAVSKTRDFVVPIGFRYKLLKGLDIEVKYQFENQLMNNSTIYSDSSYYVRNLINLYTQVNGTTLTYPIPRGGILDIYNSEVTSHQGRGQLNFYQTWNMKHQIAAIMGWEIRSLKNTSDVSRLYGYDPKYSTNNSAIDYVTQFSSYIPALPGGRIFNPANISEATDHFLSIFANASYTYANRYTISGSLRKDEANLFGNKTNSKGAPFFSSGIGWTISNEKFYHQIWLPFLRIRATYGYNGNISRLTAGVETGYYSTGITTPATIVTLATPPDGRLRWEKTGITNLGIDFSTKSRALSGTIELYWKNVKDLMAQYPLDPTLGFSISGNGSSGNQDATYVYGNVANMKGKGVDIHLTSKNITGRFEWVTDWVFSYAISKVTKYLVPEGLGNLYLDQGAVNPIIGKPVYAVYSYKWQGLDHQTGSPIGYLNGKSSMDYASIMGTTKLDSLLYNGSAVPLYFGAVRNTVSWNKFSLSFNISYKFKYFFRKPGLSYTSLFASYSGSGDFSHRWKNPGDEVHTSIPSMIYPSDGSRDGFYGKSSVLVEKGDNIRLEDICLGYDIDQLKFFNLLISHVRMYVYTSNLGVIWKANKDGIDPYFNNIVKPSKPFSVGMNINFK